MNVTKQAINRYLKTFQYTVELFQMLGDFFGAAIASNANNFCRKKIGVHTETTFPSWIKASAEATPINK